MYVCLKNLCKEFTALVFKITVEIVSVIWFLNIMEDCRNFAVNFKRSVSKIQRNSLTFLPYEILKIMIILEETEEQSLVGWVGNGATKFFRNGPKQRKIESSKKDGRKTVILFPLRLASLTQRNLQWRKIIHGMHPVEKYPVRVISVAVIMAVV